MISVSFLGNTKIVETRHIADVLSLIDEEAWFLVDLDNTMFEAKQALGHANWIYDELDQKMQKGISREEALRDFHPIWSKIQEKCPVKPLEENFVPGLIELQNRGIVVMGFTHRPPYVASATLDQVASLGIDFIKTAPSKDTFSVPATNPTLYQQGILFVGDLNNKGDVLVPFLAMTKERPKKIVFIDDKKKNLEDLERTLGRLGIDYIGIHYTAIEYANPIYSREIAEFQYQHSDRQMSNEEALILMQKNLEST